MNVEKTESDKLLAGMFAAGVILSCAVVLMFCHMGFLREFSLVFGTQFFSGREFAMLHGASKDISSVILILVSFLTDISAVLVGLPVFVVFFKELKTFPPLIPFMNYSKIVTSNKGGIIHKFGLLGLFVFCFLPFQMTGGLATACFAKLLGFGIREIVPVVFISSFSASLFWALTADTVMEYLGPIQHCIPYFIIFVVVIILIYNFTHYR